MVVICSLLCPHIYNPVSGLVFYQGISLVAGSFVDIFNPAFGHFAGIVVLNHDLSGETIDERET